MRVGREAGDGTMRRIAHCIVRNIAAFVKSAELHPLSCQSFWVTNLTHKNAMTNRRRSDSMLENAAIRCLKPQRFDA